LSASKLRLFVKNKLAPYEVTAFCETQRCTALRHPGRVLRFVMGFGKSQDASRDPVNIALKLRSRTNYYPKSKTKIHIIPTVSKLPAVYILASKRNGTLYIGVTSNLVKRVWEHKNNMVDGFTKRYNVHRLVWYELHESMESAITKEKKLKKWKRKWKLDLIEKNNPKWIDLYDKII
jgi:putative endonuclease